MSEFFGRPHYESAAAAVRQRARGKPVIGLVLGSGLSSLADQVEGADVIPYDEIPHWPVTTVAGHAGQVVVGSLAGKQVMILQGRTHFYEGYPMSQVTLAVRVMTLLGVRTLIVTNAAGGINSSFAPGDLMLIRDHLNLPGLAGQNPLRGANDEQFGPRFPDMTQAYDADLRRLALEVAEGLGFRLQQGVYAFVSGPSYETPAELRLLRTLGADAVGMSTVPEVVVARHANMRVLGISSITNMALPDPADGVQLLHSDVLEIGRQIVPRLQQLVYGVISRL
ncbi:MAG: purine-nucleoside phosphorylase [Candidatus Promineifilaceae bacterium]